MKASTHKCLNCGHEKTFYGRKVNTSDGKRCEKCDGPVRPTYKEVNK